MMAFLPNRYLKYIFIALFLAILSHSLIVFVFQQVQEMRNQITGLDKQVAVMDKQMAVLDERMQYFIMIGKNSETMEGGYNAAESNSTK